MNMNTKSFIRQFPLLLCAVSSIIISQNSNATSNVPVTITTDTTDVIIAPYHPSQQIRFTINNPNDEAYADLTIVTPITGITKNEVEITQNSIICDSGRVLLVSHSTCTIEVSVKLANMNVVNETGSFMLQLSGTNVTSGIGEMQNISHSNSIPLQVSEYH